MVDYVIKTFWLIFSKSVPNYGKPIIAILKLLGRLRLIPKRSSELITFGNFMNFPLMKILDFNFSKNITLKHVPNTYPSYSSLLHLIIKKFASIFFKFYSLTADAHVSLHFPWLMTSQRRLK